VERLLAGEVPLMHRQRNPFASGLAATIVLAVLMVGVVISGIPAGPQIPVPWDQKKTLHVQLVDADALAPHASVEIGGVKIGEVQSVSAQGSYALATLVIEKRYGDLHRDATIYLRAHGLFGPKYIAIVPGTSSAPVVADGETFGVERTVQPVDLNAILQDLQAPEQQKLRTFIVEFGKAAAGKGDDVNHLFAAANSLTQVLDTPVQALDQVAPQLSDFIAKNEAFNAYFAQAPLDQLVANSETTVKVFADNAGHLQSLLAHANTALAELNIALGPTSGGSDGAHNLTAVIRALGQQGGTTDRLNTFTYLLALYGASLTGRDKSDPNDLNVTAGIIGAIENVKSAFASGDPCTPAPGSHCDVAPNAVDANGNLIFDHLQHYLRVQVFNFPPTPGSPVAGTPLAQICTLPVIGQLPIVCPAAYQSTGGQAFNASDLNNFADLLAS
jgi:virulence factor Mce-like protein